MFGDSDASTEMIHCHCLLVQLWMGSRVGGRWDQSGENKYDKVSGIVIIWVSRAYFFEYPYLV